MKLKELLAISKFDSYDIWILDENGKSVKFIYITSADSPDYTGPFYSKGHREKQKANTKAIKEYADCEVSKITCSFSSNPSIWCIERRK